MKKVLSTILALFCGAISMFTCMSCKESTGSIDSQSQQESNSEVEQPNEHDFIYGVCSICGMEEEVANYFIFTLNDDKKSYTIGVFDEEDKRKAMEYCNETQQEMTECTVWPEEIQEVIDAIGKELIIPSGYKGLPVTHIQECGFMLCDFESCTIPNTIISIGMGAFSRCRNLKSFTLPKSVEEIGGWAFSYCYSLKNLEITESVTMVGDYPFADCEQFEYNEYNGGFYIGNKENPYIALVKTTWEEFPSYVIPSGTKTIACLAFEGCSTLERLEIPASVTSINGWALVGCTNLSTIIFKGTVAQWNAISKDANWLNKDVPATQVICSDETVALNA